MLRPLLSTVDPELRDLARNNPSLVDVDSGDATGVRLVHWLGSGGMSSVFLAEYDRSVRSKNLTEAMPTRLAVKFLKPEIQHAASRLNIEPPTFFLREVLALSRMRQRQPRTPYVIDFYGCGHSAVQVRDQVLTLPWLAIEYVESEALGGTLTSRVDRSSPEGVDPVRALRLARGIFDGVRALHEERIIHRDLKPDNVLVSGPVDDEIPKLADCGIARVEELLNTVAAATPAYGGPEQLLTFNPTQRNPLVGPWTDVHALAAVIWFLLGGESWCQGENDVGWHRGARRSLRTARHLHEGLLSSPGLLERLDAVLARGAAQRLPRQAILEAQKTGHAEPYLEEAELRFSAIFSGEERFASAKELGDALFPLLSECADAWRKRCAAVNRPTTAFRTTEPISGQRRFVVEPRRAEHAAEIAKLCRSGPAVPALPGSAVFREPERALVRMGERLFYLEPERAHRVVVLPEHVPLVASCEWLVLAHEGYAAVGPAGVLVLRSSDMRALPLPERPSGGEVGEIQTAIGGSDVFGIVTAETEDSNGGAELWTFDGRRWSPPIVIPLGGDVRGACHGPDGFIFVGSRRGTRGRALWLPFDHQPVVFVQGVNDGPPLQVATWGTAREAWAAGEGVILCLQRGSVTRESLDVHEPPVAMGLDLQGVPWLVTERAVLRRHLQKGAAPRWDILHLSPPERPPFVAIGFAQDGARVLDAMGDVVVLTISRGARQGGPA